MDKIKAERSKLERLRYEYSIIRGGPFTHFFCPILFRDEHTDLCKAHIINRCFPDSSRTWTIQRKDVDNFYGSNFESEFASILYKDTTSLGDTFTNRKLAKIFSPKILVDNEKVEFYLPDGEIPNNHTPVEFDNNGELIKLGLKMSQADLLASKDKDWEISANKDIRIAALVSLIKAAHLTLFEMLGYHYALTTGGYFIGRQILGEFYLQNLDKNKSVILGNAIPFFREYAHIVRPIQSSGIDFKGTITDNLMLLCKENHGLPWAFIIIIKIMESLHAVMLPIMDQPDKVAQYLTFLKSDIDEVTVTLCLFEKDKWEIDKRSGKLHWPKDGVLYP